MGSRAKKRQREKQAREQSSLSLDEILEKHWTRRRWDGYVNVFARRPEEASQVPGATERFNKAVRNLLQTQVFVERDPEGLELSLDLLEKIQRVIRHYVEPETARCITLCGCLRRYAVTGRLHYKAKPETPAFKALYEELTAERAPAQPPDEDRAQVAKLQKSWEKLTQAKGVAPFTAFLQQAERFAEERWDNPRIQDLALFAGALREAAGARSAYASYEQAAARVHAMTENPNFTACSELWPRFLHYCQQKFGRQWNAASMRLLFSIHLDENPRTSAQVQCFGSALAEAARQNARDPFLSGLKKLLQTPKLLSDREFCLAGLLYFSLLPRTETTLADVEREGRGTGSRRPELFSIADTVSLLLDVAAKSGPLRGGARQPEAVCAAFEQAAGLAVLRRDHALRTRFAEALAGLPAKTRLVCALGAGTPLPEGESLRIDEQGLESLAMGFLAWTREKQALAVKDMFRAILDRLVPDCRPGFASRLCREAVTLGFGMPFAWIDDYHLRGWDRHWESKYDPEDYEDESVHDTYLRAASFWHALDGVLRGWFLDILPGDDPARPIIALAGDVPMTVSKNSAVQTAVINAGYPCQIYLGLWFWCCERTGASLTFLARIVAKGNPLIERFDEWEMLIDLLKKLPRERLKPAAEALWSYWSKKRKRDRDFVGAKNQLERMLGK